MIGLFDIGADLLSDRVLSRPFQLFTAVFVLQRTVIADPIDHDDQMQRGVVQRIVVDKDVVSGKYLADGAAKIPEMVIKGQKKHLILQNKIIIGIT